MSYSLSFNKSAGKSQSVREGVRESGTFSLIGLKPRGSETKTWMSGLKDMIEFIFELTWVKVWSGWVQSKGISSKAFFSFSFYFSINITTKPRSSLICVWQLIFFDRLFARQTPLGWWWAKSGIGNIQMNCIHNVINHLSGDPYYYLVLNNWQICYANTAHVILIVIWQIIIVNSNNNYISYFWNK